MILLKIVDPFITESLQHMQRLPETFDKKTLGDSKKCGQLVNPILNSTKPDSLLVVSEQNSKKAEFMALHGIGSLDLPASPAVPVSRRMATCNASRHRGSQNWSCC